ncbi:thioesterase-like superfamily-domain-containing protein [Xylaria sp. FL0933]|nr:thioesterase-like superfamily-domain-containing protein [Xylaria sp. FL0933]
MPPRPHVKVSESLCALWHGRAIPARHFRTPASFAIKSTYSTARTRELRTSQPLPPKKWVSDIRGRIGKCISFGCDQAQVQRAAEIIGTLAREWRVLSAGSEGFLGGRGGGLEDQQVVWGEMDSFGHVNNTNYIRYAESSRVNWILHFAVEDPAHREAWGNLMQPKAIGLIMKSITAEYKFPMTAPDTISAYHRLRIRPEESHTSLMLECIILSHTHRRVAARTIEDVSIYDYREAKKMVLPDFMIDVFHDRWRKQEERSNWARERIWGLLNEVESLEKETWNRADAVEDLGAAKSAGDTSAS